MKGTTRGALAEATGVGAETIRYYEQIGLLPPPERTANGYRVYTPAHAQRLTFIRHARDLGLSLDAVRELLTLANDRLRSCARVDRLVQEHIHELDHKIAGLTELRRELGRIAELCRGGGKIGECRILEALGEHEPPPEPACEDEACNHKPSKRVRA
ncbi:MAG: helix-turn-helix domain-containing protein [Myxococcales bacterium]|jgi:Cu(I)-responsive transcriptional regulator|nr:helix-turn-helix domain-containing protein [Myxococcales bacterium]